MADERISAAEARAMAGTPGVLLLDVRDAAEVQAAGKAKGGLT